jgi:YhcH/YjgK/YiaL family protein
MIIDHIRNYRQYLGLGKNIARALEHINENVPAFAGGRFLEPKNRYELNGSVYVLVNNYPAKAPGEGRLEAHRKYIDVQYVALGNERVGWAPLDDRPPVQAYDEQNDIAFFGGPHTLLPFNTGMFAIFSPQDFHMPGIEVAPGESPSYVRKVVVKVLV